MKKKKKKKEKGHQSRIERGIRPRDILDTISFVNNWHDKNQPYHVMSTREIKTFALQTVSLISLLRRP